MTKDEIISGNKLIYAFVGYDGSKFQDIDWLYNCHLHNSWNALMPVLKLCYNAAPPRTKMWQINNSLNYRINESYFYNNDINTVYTLLVSFIKWYAIEAKRPAPGKKQLEPQPV